MKRRAGGWGGDKATPSGCEQAGLGSSATVKWGGQGPQEGL